jgi:translation initiation factor 3 subunit C
MGASSEDESSEEDVKKAAPKGKTPAKPAASPAVSGDGKPKYGRGFFTKSGPGSGSESSSDDEEFDPDASDSEDYSDSDKNTRWKLKKGGDEPSTAAGKKKKPPKDKGQITKPKADKQEKEKVVVKEMTGEQVDKRLGELLALRGKRGTDKLEQIEQLELLVQFAKNDAQLTGILMHLVSAQFDATPAVATHMPANLWKGVCVYSARRMTRT